MSDPAAAPDRPTLEALAGEIARLRLALIDALHQAGGVLLGANAPEPALHAWQDAHALADPGGFGAAGDAALRQKRAFLGHDLGHLHLSRGAAAAAAVPLAEAVAIWRAADPPPPALATALGALGAARAGAGDPAGGLACRREAAALAEAAAERLGTLEARAGLAGSLIALGRDHLALGQAHAAADCFARARATGTALVAIRAAPGLRVLAAAALYHLGRARRVAGDDPGALGCFETSAAEMRVLVGEGRAELAEDLRDVEAALAELHQTLATGPTAAPP